MSALSRDYSATLSAYWIIDRRMDLTWFIGAAVGGYALFFMHAGLGWDMVRIWFLWEVFLDSPHFFGTFSSVRRQQPGVPKLCLTQAHS